MIIATHRNPETLPGKGVGFERIRRITGYLVGTLERFNNAKRCEEKDRVKHDRAGLLPPRNRTPARQREMADA